MSFKTFPIFFHGDPTTGNGYVLSIDIFTMTGQDILVTAGSDSFLRFWRVLHSQCSNSGIFYIGEINCLEDSKNSANSSSVCQVKFIYKDVDEVHVLSGTDNGILQVDKITNFSQILTKNSDFTSTKKWKISLLDSITDFAIIEEKKCAAICLETNTIVMLKLEDGSIYQRMDSISNIGRSLSIQYISNNIDSRGRLAVFNDRGKSVSIFNEKKVDLRTKDQSVIRFVNIATRKVTSFKLVCKSSSQYCIEGETKNGIRDDDITIRSSSKDKDEVSSLCTGSSSKSIEGDMINKNGIMDNHEISSLCASESHVIDGTRQTTYENGENMSPNVPENIDKRSDNNLEKTTNYIETTTIDKKTDKSVEKTTNNIGNSTNTINHPESVHITSLFTGEISEKHIDPSVNFIRKSSVSGTLYFAPSGIVCLNALNNDFITSLNEDCLSSDQYNNDKNDEKNDTVCHVGVKETLPSYNTNSVDVDKNDIICHETNVEENTNSMIKNDSTSNNTSQIDKYSYGAHFFHENFDIPFLSVYTDQIVLCTAISPPIPSMYYLTKESVDENNTDKLSNYYKQLFNSILPCWRPYVFKDVIKNDKRRKNRECNSTNESKRNPVGEKTKKSTKDEEKTTICIEQTTNIRLEDIQNFENIQGVNLFIYAIATYRDIFVFDLFNSAPIYGVINVSYLTISDLKFADEAYDKCYVSSCDGSVSMIKIDV